MLRQNLFLNQLTRQKNKYCRPDFILPL